MLLEVFCLKTSHPLEPLALYFKKLPGIGEKTAYRLAFHILTRPKSEIESFSKQLLETKDCICSCEICYTISNGSVCSICSDPQRVSQHKLCVVSEPRDVFSLEKTGVFQGIYHVLGGLISPLDGIHPEALRIQELIDRINEQDYQEIILAINPTVEGDATLLYLQECLKHLKTPLSKLSYGLPMGADIEYADSITLKRALEGRVML